MVKFCTTGRKVKGLDEYTDRYNKKLDDLPTENGRFPNLIDSMKVTIAQAALRKAQDNYNKKYKELDAQMRKENVKLAERIAQVREERDAADRLQLSARACLSLGTNSALPADIHKGENNVGEYSEGYTSSSTTEDGIYRETVTATFSPTTSICRKCVRSQSCSEVNGSGETNRRCLKWEAAVETCEETQF
jgi:hypothetical protein